MSILIGLFLIAVGGYVFYKVAPYCLAQFKKLAATDWSAVIEKIKRK